jgi:opacity protein-like surface antigen
MRMKVFKLLFCTLCLPAAFGFCAVSPVRADEAFDKPAPSLWQARTDDAFRKGATELDVSAGGGLGMPIFGSVGHSQWGLGMIEFGWMLSDPVATDRWYRGNWEMLADIFGGAQFHPDTAYVVGGGPELRYNFLTGTRWVPFFSAGAGITATDIRNGDLSTTFEFNLHAGPGLHVFLKENVALTLQYRFIHLSNAGMDVPNLGVNSSNFVVGLSCFF